MANWTPDSLPGLIFQAVGQHVPPPPGLRPPAVWGTEERLRELFGDRLSSLMADRRTVMQRYRSPEHWLEVFRTYFGPVVRAFTAVGPQGEAGLSRDLLALAEQFNRSGDETAILTSDYLEVVATRR